MFGLGLLLGFDLNGLKGGWKDWAGSTPPCSCLSICVKSPGDPSCKHYDPEGLTVAYCGNVVCSPLKISPWGCLCALG